MNTSASISNALKSLNLSDNAIKAYLACFKLGRLSIGQLAKHSEMDRSSCYLACDQLKKIGLLEEQVENKKIVWVKPPKEIINRLKIEQRKIRSQIEIIEEALPSLNAEYSTKTDNQPIIQFFTGKDGLRQIVENILDSDIDEILLFSNPDDEKTVFTKQDHDNFINERLKKQIKIRVIATESPLSQKLIELDGASIRKTKIVGNSFNFKNEMYIFGDMVAVLGFSSQIHGYIIKSEEFSRLQRLLFNNIWNNL
jgi:HTH-type transcriptional regulator, sugar sensing transcriptional regulator